MVHEETGINDATVRKYCRDLLRDGKILQPYPSHYCSVITHGMIVVPLRTHNVVFSVDAPWLSFSDDVTEFTGGVKVRLQFGLQRRRITVRISCRAGMDENTIIFALNRAYDIVENKTSHVVEKVILKTLEANRDFVGVRLDGVKCYTRKGLFGVVERIYQKDDKVRAELKVSSRSMINHQIKKASGLIMKTNVIPNG